jgi:hypothetical protein
MYELAQANMSVAWERLDHPRLAGFMDSLDRIDALARVSPGFVWRPTVDDVARDIEALLDDPWRVVLNLSVWESMEALWQFTYTAEHVEVMRKRGTWFDPAGSRYVLWWVPAGHRPTIAEALAKLDRLDRHGPSAEGFTFRQRHGPPLSRLID